MKPALLIEKEETLTCCVLDRSAKRLTPSSNAQGLLSQSLLMQLSGESPIVLREIVL